MKILWRVVFVVTGITASFLSSGSADESQPAIGEDDRIVFLGDSITEAGDRPNGYVDLVRQTFAEQSPDLNVQVIGAGISGNKVPDLEARLDRDVLSKNPTRVIVYIGINDVWHFRLDGHQGTDESAFENGLNNLVDRIRAVGAKVTLCTPSVIGEKTDGSNELDEMLDTYANITRKVADEKKTSLIDLRKAFLQELKTLNAEQKPQGLLTTDGVHLNPAGDRFVAAQMLSALGVKPMTDRLLRHVVLFKFKEGTTPEQLKTIEATFAALPAQIPQIHEFEWGTDISVENLAKGYTHCFLVSFLSAADREIYLPHAAHRGFVDVAKPHIDEVLVVDYWTK